MNLLLRRRKLGKGSCLAIQKFAPPGLFHVHCHEKGRYKGPSKVDYAFRWGCTADLDEYLEDIGGVVNHAKAITLASQKYWARMAFQKAGVSIPRTWNAVPGEDFPAQGVIVRPDPHHQGRALYHCTTPQEALRTVALLEARGKRTYVSEYIPKEREFRIYVIQGRVACVAEKKVPDPHQIGWNHFLGGTFENVRWKEWPIAECVEGINAAKALGLDFGGVDIMSLNGAFWVLEANAAPSLTSPYRQECFAHCFAYMVEHGRQPIPLEPGKRATWGRLIHPAVKEPRDGAA